jgi:hypothetical protein
MPHADEFQTVQQLEDVCTRVHEVRCEVERLREFDLTPESRKALHEAISSIHTASRALVDAKLDLRYLSKTT